MGLRRPGAKSSESGFCQGRWRSLRGQPQPVFRQEERRLDPFQFADLKLSPVVARGRHAVAVDEMREDFVPTLWDADQRITQLLFVGAHADVGGGYPQSNEESALSDATLK